jgi:hypothetical protein
VTTSIPALPVYSTRGSLQRARTLLPGRVLETEVERAIARGEAAWDYQGALVRTPVFAARLTRSCSRTNPTRRIWLISWVGKPS